MKKTTLRQAAMKLAFVAIALFAPLGLRAQSLLFSEDFEGGSMPTGWTKDGYGTWSVATGDYTSSTGAGNGTYNAKTTHGTTGNATKLITPEIDLSGATSAVLSYMHVQRSWSGDIDELRVYYRASSSDSWTLLDGQVYTNAVDSWTTEEDINLPNLSSTYQIAFEFTDKYGYGVGIDNIVITKVASCPTPVLNADDITNITAHTADVEWSNFTENTNYEVSYRTAAYFTGETEEFGNGMPTGWARYEGLLSGGTATLNSVNDNNGWRFDTRNGVFDNHARLNIFGTNHGWWLVTPDLTVPGNGALTFDMALTAYSGDDLPTPRTNGTDDRFVVLITTDGMATWTVLREWNNSGSEYVYNNITCSATGENVMINLGGYVGQTVQIAFYGESTTGNADNNLHIDNVGVGDAAPAGEWQTHSVTENSLQLTNLVAETSYEVKVAGYCDETEAGESHIQTFRTLEQTCTAPTAFTLGTVTDHKATFSWTAGDGNTEWQVYVKKHADAEYPATANATVTAATATINSLDVATVYDVKIVPDCDDTKVLEVANAFTTDCEANVVDTDNPFFEGFEGTTFPPNCWSVGDGDPFNDNNWQRSEYTGPACAYSHFYGPIYLYTPILHIDGTAATLSFSSYNKFPDDYDKNSVLVSVNGGDWTELWSPESVSQSWVVTTIDMTDYVGENIKLCFKYEGNNAHGWYIDYVNLYVPTVIDKAIEANKWYAISSPVHNSGNDETLEGTNLTTGTYDLFGYNEATGYWDKPTVLEQGKGYIYRAASEVTLRFVGSPNSGDISHDLSYACTTDNDLKGFNLVGNPYPLPATCGMPCYRLTTTGTWHAELISYNVPVCEAVLVKTNGTGNHVSFTTSSAKSATNAPALAFTVSNDEYEDVAYAILDGQGDAQNSSLPKIGHLEPNAPALSIPVGGKNYAIATLGSNSKSFDMAFSGMGDYTISVDANANVNYLHLIDKLTGSDIDLLLNNSYSFRASIGDIASRFVVKLVPGGDNGNAGNFAFWNGTGWTVEGEGPLYVFDALGRKILSMDVDTQTTINKSQLPSTGVYILRLGEKTQKIVVK